MTLSSVSFGTLTYKKMKIYKQMPAYKHKNIEYFVQKGEYHQTEAC